MLGKKIKRKLMRIFYLPARLRGKLYTAASYGKIWFPDKLFQKWDYKIHTGKKLSFKNPQTYNEKLQWLKYYYHEPLFTKLVDKYEVREYVTNKVGKDILVPCYGVYDSWEDIDFENLPNSFVIKCTHDSGSCYICKNKNNFNEKEAKKIIVSGLKRNQFYLSREWPYKGVKPRIIIEEYLYDSNLNDLIDYKLMCFNGKVKRIYTVSGRNSVNGPFEDYFDISWNHLKIKHHYSFSCEPPKAPINLEKMINYAEIISKEFPFVRVDFYEVNAKLYFGEITFFPSGGRIPFSPDEVDIEMGNWIHLPRKQR